MEPTTLAVIVIGLAIVGIVILRSSFRRKRAESVPNIRYVDETLLDLVRTKQITGARDYYQKHSGVTTEDAERAIEYLIRRPESLMLLVRLHNNDHAPLYMDDKLMEILKTRNELKAIAYYADKTNGDMREAQVAVGALIVNPEMKFKNSN